jgi:hypothetical protein
MTNLWTVCVLGLEGEQLVVIVESREWRGRGVVSVCGDGNEVKRVGSLRRWQFGEEEGRDEKEVEREREREALGLGGGGVWGGGPGVGEGEV